MMLLAAVLCLAQPVAVDTRDWEGFVHDNPHDGYWETKLPRHPLRIGNRLATAHEYRVELERRGFAWKTLETMTVWQLMRLYSDFVDGVVRWELLPKEPGQ